jgi:succinyl-CoA synthetase beta subunit
VPDGGTVASEEKCVAAALEIGLPVALKLSSPELQHKSDYGAIALDLGSEDEVRAAFGRLMASPAGPGARVLVERMVKPGLELFVAARADGVVPALVVGLGGIWTESLDDVAIVPLPADRERVERALLGLRGAALLDGGRGGKTLDVRAVAELAVRVSELLGEEDLELLELNPVVVHTRGCVALDATALRAGPREREGNEPIGATSARGAS